MSIPLPPKKNIPLPPTKSISPSILTVETMPWGIDDDPFLSTLEQYVAEHTNGETWADKYFRKVKNG
jgi:hypothetical protein